MSYNPKKLQTALSEAGNLKFPSATDSNDRDCQARHDALLAHELLEAVQKLVDALVATNRTDLALVEDALSAAAPFLAA